MEALEAGVADFDEMIQGCKDDFQSMVDTAIMEVQGVKDMVDMDLDAAIQQKIMEQQDLHDMAKADMADVNDEIADEMDEMAMMVTDEMTNEVDALIQTVNNVFAERQAIVEAIEDD